MTFSLVMKNARTLRNVIEALSSIVDEANLIASKNGLETRALDVARAAVVELQLPENTFEKYEFTGDESLVLGIKLKELLELLRLAKPMETLRLWLNTEEARLYLELQGSSSTRMFSLALFDLGGHHGKRAQINSDVSIMLSSDLFVNAVRTCEKGGDQVTIQADEHKLVFLSKTSTRDVKFEVTGESPEVLKYAWMKKTREAKAHYGMNYLRSLIKGVKLAEMVKLDFATDNPIRVTYEIPGGGHITYIVAPRVEWTDD